MRYRGTVHRLWPIVCIALASCDGSNGSPPDDEVPNPTTPPGNTTDDECASDEILEGTLGACDDAFPACGGDVTGTWVVDDWCSTDTETGTTTYNDELCEGDLVQRSLHAASTLNFATDGTLQSVLTAALDITWTFPSGCFEELGYDDCDDVETELDLECTTDAGGGCTCTTAISLTFQGESTWSTCEGRLVIDEMPGTVTGTYYGTPTATTTTFGPHETDYCVDGDRLRIDSADFEFAGFYRRP